VGWSYGGYAALQAAATEPGLFKAVAAIAPVTDLSLLKEEAQQYTSGAVVEHFVGSGPHVREGSPLQRAREIKVPVLLAHGDLDLNVGIAHSTKMEGALRSSGTPVQMLRYSSLDHQLEDSVARSEVLTAVGALLEKNIGR
jgi:dipeptidyl aminopeptidase/acylaminoacyl peptidase